jgi:hypothetical protein
LKKNGKNIRKPFTRTELEEMMPSARAGIKLYDEEFALLREINAQRSLFARDRAARLAIEEKPLHEDLRKVGWNIESIWDLVNSSGPYPEAIPVLLKHLMLPYSDRTRDGIARSLAVPEPAVKAAWPLLVNEYRKAPHGMGIVAHGEVKPGRLGAKDGLACALKVACTDATLEELIGLLRDRSLGESRGLLLSALRKSKNPLAKKTIEELSSDPDFEKEIKTWRRK